MPERLWVVNSSPIISLAKIGHVDILPALCEKMFVPRAVEQELLAGPEDDLARCWITTEDSCLHQTALRLAGETAQ